MLKYTHWRVSTTWLYLYFLQYVSYVYLTWVWSYCLPEFILSGCFLNDFVTALYFVLWSCSYLYLQSTFTTIMPIILTCSDVLPCSHKCSTSVLSLLLFCSWLSICLICSISMIWVSRAQWVLVLSLACSTTTILLCTPVRVSSADTHTWLDLSQPTGKYLWSWIWTRSISIKSVRVNELTTWA